MFGKSLEEKREYIAKVAGDVFYAKGFKESSLQDVSVKGNISKAGIYHYFKTKEDILLYILLKNTERGIDALNTCLEKCEERQLDHVDTFKEIIRTYANYLLNNRKVSLLVLRERHQLSGKNRSLIVEKERAVFNFLKEQLGRMPCLKSGINVNLIVFQIMSMIHWMGYWFDEKGPLKRAQAIDQTISIQFDGMLDKGK